MPVPVGGPGASDGVEERLQQLELEVLKMRGKANGPGPAVSSQVDLRLVWGASALSVVALLTSLVALLRH